MNKQTTRRAGASAKALVTRIAATTALAAFLHSCSSADFSSPTGKQVLQQSTASGASAPKTPSSPSPAPSDTDGGVGAKTPGVDAAANSSSGTTTATTTPPPPPPPKLDFGLLVNDLNCTFCHLEVHGTVVSVASVPASRFDSHGEVFGNWLIDGTFGGLQAPPAGSTSPVDGGIMASGTIVQNYNNSGGELPVDPTTKAPTFPTVNFSTLTTSTQGTLSASVSPSAPLSISKVYAGNALLVGTKAQPIIISKDILVEGDLVISGYYTGVGTIYATGNIYIPADLRAVNLASFPYSDDSVTANAQAQADLTQGNKDALGLASANNIFVGDLENYMDTSNGAISNANGEGTGPGGAQRYTSIYDNSSSDPILLRPATGIRNVYNWLPEVQFQTLYQTGTPCWTTSNRTLAPGHHWGEREFSEIDAYLYAAKAIGGVDRALNWTINGGMIAQEMHIVSGAGSDSVAANTPCAASRINFDYRMRNGMQVLEALATFFPATGTATGSGSGTTGNGSGTSGNGSGT